MLRKGRNKPEVEHNDIGVGETIIELRPWPLEGVPRRIRGRRLRRALLGNRALHRLLSDREGKSPRRREKKGRDERVFREIGPINFETGTTVMGLSILWHAGTVEKFLPLWAFPLFNGSNGFIFTVSHRIACLMLKITAKFTTRKQLKFKIFTRP